MRKGLLGSVAALAMLAATAGMARAADPVAEVTDWSGFYLGAHVGYGEANIEGCFDCGGSGGAIDQNDLDLNGVLGGVQAGYNVQMDSLVLGVEADLSLMDFSDQVNQPSGDPDNSSADIDMLASVRGRLGIAMDDVLLYATGGLAISNAESTIFNSGETLNVDYDDIGGVVGGGAEWAQSDSLRWRVEGLYYFFGDKESVSDAHSGAPGENFKFEDAFAVRLGVNWYLN